MEASSQAWRRAFCLYISSVHRSTPRLSPPLLESSYKSGRNFTGLYFVAKNRDYLILKVGSQSRLYSPNPTYFAVHSSRKMVPHVNYTHVQSVCGVFAPLVYTNIGTCANVGIASKSRTFLERVEQTSYREFPPVNNTRVWNVSVCTPRQL